MRDEFLEDYTVQVREIEGFYTNEIGLEHEDNCYSETWLDAEGRKHRSGDFPAVIVRKKDTDEVIAEEWWVHGKRHRDGAPAWIVMSSDIEKVWYQDGLESRLDGPSRQLIESSTGIVLQESWCRAGKSHRENGPAGIVRTPVAGIAEYEGWSINGQPHRIGGPAEIERDYTTGIAVSEAWKMNGKLHRDDGPAIIFRDGKTGAITRMQYFQDGVETSPPAPREPEPEH